MDKVTVQDVLGVIEKALKLKEKHLAPDSSKEDIEEWDSLGRLSILVALDKFFNGKVAGINDLANADSIEKILKTLKEHSLM